MQGLARIAASDPTGERRAFLASHGYGGVRGIVVQSASSAPWVFGQVVEQVPQAYPHQHGAFFFRDFRQQLPGHPFGRPESPDQWITTAILRRDSSVIGGSPPTLAGGLYVDWGVPGIVLGCLALGAALVGVFRWARRAGTVGALGFYAYFTAYVVLSAYNYVSAKPMMLSALALFYLMHRVELRRQQPI